MIVIAPAPFLPVKVPTLSPANACFARVTAPAATFAVATEPFVGVRVSDSRASVPPQAWAAPVPIVRIDAVPADPSLLAEAT